MWEICNVWRCLQLICLLQCQSYMFVCLFRGCRKGPLVSCDYCSNMYHLDCLTPPLTSLPTTRWMCPLHGEIFLVSIHLLNMNWNLNKSSSFFSWAWYILIHYSNIKLRDYIVCVCVCVCAVSYTHLYSFSITRVKMKSVLR